MMWCEVCFGVFQSDAVCGYMFQGNLVRVLLGDLMQGRGCSIGDVV